MKKTLVALVALRRAAAITSCSSTESELSGSGGATGVDAASSGGATGVSPACSAGLTQCGAECVDLLSSPAHCGGCRGACAANQSCENGQCVCQADLAFCSDTCVDLRSDGLNCGGCGRACPAGEVCSAGVCGTDCTVAGQTPCGQSCVDLKSDERNCGACGTACSAGEECVSGVCACTEGLTLCGGVCVDTATSLANCGTCGSVCGAAEACQGGTCVGGPGGTGGSMGSGGSTSTGGSTGTGGEAPSCDESTIVDGPNTLEVSVTSATDLVPREIFGLLMEDPGNDVRNGVWVGKNSNIPNTNGVRDDITEAFREAGVGAIECPGGCHANSYNWEANINPSSTGGKVGACAASSGGVVDAGSTSSIGGTTGGGGTEVTRSATAALNTLSEAQANRLFSRSCFRLDQQPRLQWDLGWVHSDGGGVFHLHHGDGC